MEMIEDPGTEILQPFGGVAKSLLEAISFYVNMTDHLPLIRLKRAFTFGIEGGGLGGRVRGSMTDHIPEELEDIIFFQTFQTAAAIRSRPGGAAAIRLLAKRM